MSDDNFVNMNHKKVASSRKWQILGFVSVAAACLVASQSQIGSQVQQQFTSEPDMKYDGGINTQVLIEMEDQDSQIRGLSSQGKGDELTLRGRSSSGSRARSGSSSSSGGKKGGEFFGGIILIAFALPMIWMNERKDVKYYQVIMAGKDAVKNVDSEKPFDNEWDLAFCTGRTATQTPVADQMFGVSFQDIVKIKRTVEVYQWVQHQKTEKDGADNDRTITWYVPEWKSEAIDQSGFADPGQLSGEPENPRKEDWPCNAETFNNEHVTLGATKLNSSQIDRMVDYADVDLNQWFQTMQGTSQHVFEQKGYTGVQHNGSEWVIARPHHNQGKGSLNDPVIGDMRIKLQYVQNCEVQVMAQLVNHKDVFTFRPWNPKDINAPIGQEQDVTAASCPTYCVTCLIVEKCFKTMFKEHIDDIRTDGKTPSEIFGEMIATNKTTTTIFRWLSWVLSLIGHNLLFVPVIRLISYIPLAGWLLSKFLSTAVFIFSLVWCTALHFFIMGIAWVFYRPCFGICMLALFGVGFYFMTKPYSYDPNAIEFILQDHFGLGPELNTSI